MKSVSVKDLKSLMDKGESLTLIDVQPVDGYTHRHIPGAIHLDVTEECGDQCKSILRDKDSHMIVYGEFDELGKGSKGVDVLEAAGYTNVSRLEGGLMGWMEAGYQVEGGHES